MQLFDTSFVTTRTTHFTRTGGHRARSAHASPRRASALLSREELKAIVMEMVD